MEKIRHILLGFVPGSAPEILMTENGRKPGPGGIVMPTVPVFIPSVPTHFRLS